MAKLQEHHLTLLNTLLIGQTLELPFLLAVTIIVTEAFTQVSRSLKVKLRLNQVFEVAAIGRSFHIQMT